jgi:hypothetical protein
VYPCRIKQKGGHQIAIFLSPELLGKTQQKMLFIVDLSSIWTLISRIWKRGLNGSQKTDQRGSDHIAHGWNGSQIRSLN